MINTVTYLTTSSTRLSSEQYSYDANLRATGATATWLSGSGSSGTILKFCGCKISFAVNSMVFCLIGGKGHERVCEVERGIEHTKMSCWWLSNSSSDPSARRGS